MATMIQLEKYKKTREARKQYYYSRTTYQKTEKELRTIIDESNKLRDTIKEQLKEAQKSREDENELEKIRTQIEDLQKLVEKARKKIRPFHKPQFSTEKERPQNKQTHTGPRAQHHKHRPWTVSRAGGHKRK
jgi:archaellum component FlaC